MEILSEKITPHRLHTIVRLIPRLRQPKKQEILNLLMPPKLIGEKGGKVNQDKAKVALRAAVANELLQLSQDKESYQLHPSIDGKKIDDLEYFRKLMLTRMSDATNSENPLMREFTSWYAVQNERVFHPKSNIDIAQKFHQETSGRDDENAFNQGKYSGWLWWASFLGWGWTMNLGTFPRLIPNCAAILNTSLDILLPDNDEIAMREFMGRVARKYTELDGGNEFERCWAASRPNEPRGNQISMMLTSGLHTLETEGKIKLISYNDAPDVWQFFPTESKKSNATHIQRTTKVKRGKR